MGVDARGAWDEFSISRSFLRSMSKTSKSNVSFSSSGRVEVFIRMREMEQAGVPAWDRVERRAVIGISSTEPCISFSCGVIGDAPKVRYGHKYSRRAKLPGWDEGDRKCREEFFKVILRDWNWDCGERHTGHRFPSR